TLPAFVPCFAFWVLPRNFMARSLPESKPPPADTARPTHIRFLVVALTTLMSFLLYLDRFCLSFAERYIYGGLAAEQRADGRVAGLILPGLRAGAGALGLVQRPLRGAADAGAVHPAVVAIHRRNGLGGILRRGAGAAPRLRAGADGGLPDQRGRAQQ